MQHHLADADMNALNTNPNRFLLLDVCCDPAPYTRDYWHTIFVDQEGFQVRWNGPFENVYSLVARNCEWVGDEAICVASPPVYYDDTPLPEPGEVLGLVVGAAALGALCLTTGCPKRPTD